MRLDLSGYPPGWQLAIERATRDRRKAYKLNSSAYAVPSLSARAGGMHVVTLDGTGKIVHCSNCYQWNKGGRTSPCAHAGAVAKRLIREAHALARTATAEAGRPKVA